MLALCLMLLVTYYALNYAGIISLGLRTAQPNHLVKCSITVRVGLASYVRESHDLG